MNDDAVKVKVSLVLSPIASQVRMDTEVVEPSAPVREQRIDQAIVSDIIGLLQSSNVHLLVLCHGLWGTPEHLHM